MKKTMIALALVLILALLLSTTVFAQSEGFGGKRYGTCLRENLEPEEQARFNEIIAVYRAKMLEFREEMKRLRAAGDGEAFRAAMAKRFELMEEKRAALSEFLPEKFAEGFQNCGRNMRNYGVERGSSGFGMKNGNRP